MKKKIIKITMIVPALAGLILLASISNFTTKTEDKNSASSKEVEITIDKTIHEFGTINERGGTVSATFTLTNNSKKSFLITTVTTSCGCTVSEWTKKPVEYKKTGEVTVTYDPASRIGFFDKSILIITTGNPERLEVTIRGTVE